MLIRKITLVLVLTFALTLVVGTPSASAEEKAKITFEKVDYAGLDKAVAKHKGKVVVMDLWGFWCIPCLQKFPKFVKMSEKYKGKDVVFMSLCLPIEEDNTIQPKGVKFLTKMKATFPNFLLADHKGWGDKFNTAGAPAVRIYGKDGKLVQQFSPGVPNADWGLPDVEKAIEKLLN